MLGKPSFLWGTSPYKMPLRDGAKESLSFVNSSGARKTSGQTEGSIQYKPIKNEAKMKVPLLLALLFGAVSTLQLGTVQSNSENFLGDEAVPQDGEMPDKEAPPGELTLLEEEEEGYSGSDDSPEEEGAAESVSALDQEDEDFQCPKEEDTVKLGDSPVCKNCPRFLLVRKARIFSRARFICRRCYRGNLVSIHNFQFNHRLLCSVRGLNQGQVWIGGRIVGWGVCKRFRWVDGSHWNFGYWAAGEPRIRGGRCVALCTQGGRWRRAPCHRRLPFFCSY
ncbi:LOW QUALITY PROTEIN: bone marrow proteoglycan [Ursus americanus]|uniref:LOW QUALITY PROTEIN: bone marrow proteoglycan n=2 Tax=Ursus TaxID=9639 RepID=UPI001E67BBEA|nr:LOW QUALITY PROTEIN: bone marrow proteoglycan [Ursus americanus]